MRGAERQSSAWIAWFTSDSRISWKQIVSCLGRGMGTLGVWFLLPAMIQGAVQGASPIAHFGYTRTLWRVSDGLPEDTVQTLAESKEGLLWIGTTGGLAHFDGSRMEVYGHGLAQPLSANSIFCVTFARNGDLWAGTEGGGLLRLHDRELQIYSTRQGLTDGFVRSVYQDERERLWVGTDNGLFVLEGERLRRVDQADALGPIAVHAITQDRNHRLWVGGSRLLAIRADGSTQEFPLPGAYSENRVKSILQTKDGTLWVGTVGGLQRLQHGRFERVPEIHATVRSLRETSDGKLWIGTIGQGLWSVESGRLSHVSSEGLLPSETVLSILEDDQKQIWIGTQAGLVRLSETPVSVIPLPEGGDPDFETISGDHRERLWVAAQRLYLIENNQAHRVIYPEIGTVTIRNVYAARDGALWIGTDGDGAYSLRANETTHYTAPGQLTNNFIRGFLESRDGHMWIATDEGVSRIGRDGTRKFSVTDGLAYQSTRSLLEDRHGNLWIGTDQGLSCWAADAFQKNSATRALAEEKVWSILEDRQGTLWFGTRDHGLFRYRNGAIQQFSVAQGLPSNSIYQILQDRHGTFWLTNPNSIAAVREKDMDGLYPSLDRPLSRSLSVEVYGMPFGADGAQLYGGRQPSGYLAADDTVWFPTTRGAAHVVTVKQRPQPGPRAFLDDVVEDGRTLVPGDKMQVPAHIARLSFDFSAISLRPQQGVRFRYKLENFDKGWNVSASTRTATYTNLPAGRYRFQVAVFDTADPEDVSEVDVSFIKSTFFYQTWWFYGLCGLLSLGIAWTLYQLRLRQMRTRFSAVLEERNRLAREMHDTVIQGCTGTSALLEAIASTADENREAKRELLDYARVQMRSTINEAREAVWNMRHEQEADVDLVAADVDLVAALEGIAAQMSREYGSGIRFEHTQDELKVGAMQAHEILMTVREALYNSIQHSGANQAELTLHRSSNKDLEISIFDEGKGFSAERTDLAETGHYGILGMRERMQRLGGRLELKTAPSLGTTVRLMINMSMIGRSKERRNRRRV